jgi:trimethylamine corrinoid protein
VEKTELLEKMKDALVDIDEDLLMELIEESLKADITPLEILNDSLQPALFIIGEGFDKHTRFTSDLVLAGEMMTAAMEVLRPAMIAGSSGAGDVMVIGTVDGDVHNVGKRIVAAVFTGAGYDVIDIGENQPASAFVEAAKKHNAKIVGASAILGPQKPYCKVIHDALVEAGIRDDVIYIIGGWGMTQEWCDRVHADAYGDTAYEAIDKVRELLS